ncbi:MAG: heme utilization cystosolic carrier protein HutX [Pseudomonadota bacterium]
MPDTNDLPPLEERLKGFSGFLERLSKEYGMTTLELVRRLPADSTTLVDGDRMLDILKDVGEWGDILFITEARDIITGTSTTMPQAFNHDGYFHFFGTNGFGGHIKEDACQHIAFIDRSFQNRPSRSIHFYDADGEPMFKIFVSRELSGEMKADQIERWTTLAASFT